MREEDDYRVRAAEAALVVLVCLAVVTGLLVLSSFIDLP